MSIRILLLGSGGREHALAWKLSRSQLLDRLFVCPGNGGTAQEPKTVNVDLSPTYFPGLVEFALQNKVYNISRKLIRGAERSSNRLTSSFLAQSNLSSTGSKVISAKVRSPEFELHSNEFNISSLVGIPVFGPSALAARMEGSKAFSKAFMDRHNIPTAAFRVFKSHQLQEAMQYVQTCGHKIVLKASGLAGGKGVLIPESLEEAIIGLKDMMEAHVFGSAGPQFHSYAQICS